MSFLYFLSIFFFLLLCCLLTLIVLMQESKSTGLGASFGGGDSSDSLFGVSTPDILKKITVYLATVFMAGCIVLSYWTSAGNRIQTKSYGIEETSPKTK